MIENRRKAFELIDAWARLLSGLAAGTLVLSAIFAKDLLGGTVEVKEVLFEAWIFLGIATVLGPLILSVLIERLNLEKLDAHDVVIRGLGNLQFAAFLGGTILLAIFAGINL